MSIFALKERRVVLWEEAGENVVRPPSYMRIAALVAVIVITSPATIQSLADSSGLHTHVLALGVMSSIVLLIGWFELTQRVLRWTDDSLTFTTAMLTRSREGWDSVARVVVDDALVSGDKLFKVVFKDNSSLTMLAYYETTDAFIAECSKRWIEVLEWPKAEKLEPTV